MKLLQNLSKSGLSIKKLTRCLSALLLSGLCFHVLPVCAQDDNLSAGDLNYETLRFYEKAIPFYEAALKERPGNALAKAKLADCYRYMNDMSSAAAMFGDAYKLGEPLPPRFRFHYGQVLMALSRYEEAKAQFVEFGKSDEITARHFIQSCDFARAAQYATPRYLVKPEAVNSSDADFAPVLYGEEVLFCSFRSGKNQKALCRLYFSKANAEGRLSVPTLLNERVDNSERAFLSFSADLKTVFFAKHQLRNGLRFIGSTDMHQALLSANASNPQAWSEVERLKINKEGYSVGFPCLSADGKTLYFASDMPGGQGGFDLWKTSRLGDDWNTPQNLGKMVNTPGDELSPFLSAEGTLYFASDWHNGFGGLDIFAAKPNGKAWSAPENLGAPVNSAYDDFCFVEKTEKNRAYFTSNRPGGKGREDIYGATKIALPKEITGGDNGIPVNKDKIDMPGLPPIKPGKEPLPTGAVARSYLGEVRDAQTGRPIEAAFIQATHPKTRKLVEAFTDAQGNYQISLEPGTNYAVLVSARGYLQFTQALVPPNLAILEAFRLNSAVPTGPNDAQAQVPDKKELPKDLSPKGLEGPPGQPINPDSTTFTVLYPSPIDQKGRGKVKVADPFEQLPPTVADSGAPLVETVFRVQLGAYKAQREGAFADLSDIGPVELSEHPKTKVNYYFLGPYASLSGAQQARSEAVRRGVTDAFIVAFQNGQRVKITQAITD